jgi:WD40 repeat protein
LQLPAYLAAAGDGSKLYRLLTDFDFIEAKLDALGVDPLLSDFDLATKNSNRSLSEKPTKTLQLIHKALDLSAHVLQEDKTQLVGQLLGRLLDSPEIPLINKGEQSQLSPPLSDEKRAGNGDIEKLLEAAKLSKTTPWLRPLTPSLTPASTPLLRTLTGHKGHVWGVAVTPDGNTLTEHAAWVDAVAVTPDGKTAVSGGVDCTVIVWDLVSGEPRNTLRGHSNWVHAVAVTPDGKTAISGSADCTAIVWDLVSGEPVHTLTGHTGWVDAVALTPDGKTAISASSDRILKVWDVLSGEEVACFTGDESILCCAVAPDGVTVVAGEASGRVHFLRMEGCTGSLRVVRELSGQPVGERRCHCLGKVAGEKPVNPPAHPTDSPPQRV